MLRSDDSRCTSYERGWVVAQVAERDRVTPDLRYEYKGACCPA